MTLNLPALLVLAACAATGQDSREALGRRDEIARPGPHPLEAVMRAKQPQLATALRGRHPRVFATDSEIAALRTRAQTTHRAEWQRALDGLGPVLLNDPPPPPATERRVHNGVAIAIAGLSLAWRVEQKPEYLAAARKYMDAAVSYEIWGYPTNKPNVDLAAGHLLYGLGWGYDLLYADLTPVERDRYRNKLAYHARLLANYFRPKSGSTFSYSQNHVFIPVSGLAVAAYALYDEVPDAPEWAAISRAIFDRVLATYSSDGYYYEGFEYWVFSTPWIVHYLDAHLHSTGEDLYDQPGLRNAHLYVAHSVLPDGRNIFDFGDAFEGSETRSRRSPDAERTHPDGHLNSNYNLLYRLAQRFQNREAQGVARWLDRQGQVNAEDFWSLLWLDSSLEPAPMAQVPLWHYFPDHEVVYWRSGWDADATALAIKSGPPEGHQAAALAVRFPDWRLESGHAHPDAASFILYARGEYLTGDTGYSGVPGSAHHNTLLIDGKGQEAAGSAHNAFAKVPLDRLNRIRLSGVRLAPGLVEVQADFGAAYPPELGVRSAVRTFNFDGTNLSIRDDVETARPSAVVSLIHSDGDIRQSGPMFQIAPHLRLTVPGPEATVAAIEPNKVTGAGPPGAVDKGPEEQRGTRLAISGTQPATSHRISLLLRVE